jgi:hypothetical protein
MTQLFANNVSTTLNGAISTVATVLTVANGSGMPAPTGGDFFLLTLVGLDGNGNESAWEIVKVTARTGNDLTVERAQEGTSARAWPDATRCELRLTAGSLKGLGAAGWNITSTATSKTLADREWCSVTAAGQTITLPASPTAGMECRVSVGAFDDTLVNYGGADTWRINAAGATVTFAYKGTEWRYI